MLMSVRKTQMVVNSSAPIPLVHSSVGVALGTDLVLMGDPAQMSMSVLRILIHVARCVSTPLALSHAPVMLGSV
jgi:hypothetical protein